MSFVNGPPGFVPFNPQGAVRKYRRHLPHWIQDGATYFITFRLADSLPAEKLRELEAFRERWLREQADKELDSQAISELQRETMKKIEGWLDAGSGECWFREEKCARMVANALLHFHQKRYALGAHCVMPNHVHVVVRPFAGHDPDEILKSWKGFSAKEVNKLIGRQGNLWAGESHDTIVRDAAHLAKVVRYIGRNPGKAGIPKEKWYRWVDPEWQRIGWGFAEDDDGR
jgi:putative transposase